MSNRSESKKVTDIEIQSYGGTGGHVTGSCHMLTQKDSKFAVDCGMSQGAEGKLPSGDDINTQFRRSIGRGLTHVIVTHPHIDHSGLLPRIFRDGFTPTIITTEETANFMDPMLRNSAEIQKDGRPQDRLYEMKDVEDTLKHIKVVMIGTL